MGGLRHFVGESYEHAGGAAAVRNARSAAGVLAGQGREVRHVLSLLAPGDELCLHVFEADSADTVAEVGRRAEIVFDRIWAAVRLPEAGTASRRREEP